MTNPRTAAVLDQRLVDAFRSFRKHLGEADTVLCVALEDYFDLPEGERGSSKYVAGMRWNDLNLLLSKLTDIEEETTVFAKANPEFDSLSSLPPSSNSSLNREGTKTET